MKRIVTLLMTVLMTVTFGMTVLAQDDGVDDGGGKKAKKAKKAKPAKGAKKARPQMKDLVLTGKITKKEVEKKGKKRVSYLLTTADGAKVPLRAPRARKKKKGGDAAAAPAGAIKLDDYVDADVKVTAKGMEMDKGGKKLYRIAKLISIEKVGEGDAAEGVAAAEGGDDAAPAAGGDAGGAAGW